jgi:peptidoglycan/xylan/chitin deacetylase (PgdA/CDA1 family)
MVSHMSGRSRHGYRGTAGRASSGPVSRAAGRRRPAPIGVWLGVFAAIVVALAAGRLVMAGVAAHRTPAPKVATRQPAATSAPSAGSSSATQSTGATTASTPDSAPAASVTSTESASAVRAAALRYPNPPAIKPLTIRKAAPKRKLVAITLDDGIPFNTKILDLFEARGIRCTTFLLGQAVRAHPDLVRRLNKDGFEIANHTWDHKTLTKLSDAQILSEWSRTQAAISAITGNQAPYMRPPGGGTNLHVRSLAASMGYHVVLWDKSFADTSRAATPQRLFHNVMDTLKPGEIILCHWGGRDTYEALQLILPEMERRGFTPVTLSEMLADSAQAK